MGEGPGYLVTPEKMEELAQYDVIFIGDVGMGAKGLTQEQAKLLKGMVEQQASGIVFLPGYQGKQMELLQSELADLDPRHLPSPTNRKAPPRRPCPRSFSRRKAALPADHAGRHGE